MEALKRFIIIVSVLILLFLLFFGVYFYISYLEFKQKKDVILDKIFDLAESLENNKEEYATNIEDILDEEGDGTNTKNVSKQNIPTVIYDRNNKIIAKFVSDKFRLTQIKEMPYYLTKGFILIEDKDFFNHRGINYRRTFIALINNILTFGRSGGGSTISQQLSKILFTKHERKFKRKIFELFCTFELEKTFSKEEILQIYLNLIYMGHGNYGIANASNFYFNKMPQELNIAEAALLIGMNRSPERYSPIKSKENARYIQKIILSKFVQAKLLDEAQADYEFNKFWEKFNSKNQAGEQSIWKTEINYSGYLTEYVRQVLNTKFDYDKIVRNGLIVETAFDIDRQNLAERILSKNILTIREKTKELSIKNNKNYSDDVINRVEGAFVSMDYNSGDVFVMVGGSRYSFSNQLNRAINSYRQVGSAIKPFVYAMAFEKEDINGIKFNPFTKMKDEVETYIVSGKKYTPKNYSASHKYGNTYTIYDALKYSLNTIAVKTLSYLNIGEVANFIQEAGDVQDKRRIPEVLSLALGSCELTPLELTTAYSIFGNGGYKVKPVMIKKIYDNKGNVYFDANRDENPDFPMLNTYKYEKKQILSSESAYLMLQTMKGVFDKGGTGYYGALVTGLKKVAYGKSGTSQDYRDGWFCGLTYSEVSSCWIGIDTNESMLSTSETTASVVWCDYNANVSSSLESNIKIPSNMKLVKIDIDTGLIATPKCKNVVDFYFKVDGVLPERCYIHEKEEIPALTE